MSDTRSAAADRAAFTVPVLAAFVGRRVRLKTYSHRTDNVSEQVGRIVGFDIGDSETPDVIFEQGTMGRCWIPANDVTEIELSGGCE